MKKFAVIFLAAVLLLALAVPASAAASCYLSGPEEVRSGDTITVTFHADGNTTGISGVISYNEDHLVLKEYKQLIGSPWVVEFSGNNFLCYDNSMENPLISGKAIFSATFQVKADVAVGTVVKVSAGSVTLSNSQGDQYVGSVSWSKYLSKPRSGNANLAELTVSNATITPAFDPNVTEYKASVPFETTKLKVSATPEDAGAKVTVSNTDLGANKTNEVTVTVTAENGTTKTYRILVWRPQDPNYEPSGVSTLESLAVEGFPISPEFSQDKMDYAVYLPHEVESIQITAKPTDPKAKVEIPTVENIPVGVSTYEVTVTAENGNIRIFTITTFRAEPFAGPNAIPEETEPATEPETEPVTEPTETVAEPTETVTEPTEPVSENTTGSRKTGMLWIVSVVAAFLGGFVLPMFFWNRE